MTPSSTNSILRFSRNIRALAAVSRFCTKANNQEDRVVLIDTVRTPFLKSNGLFRNLMSVDLQCYAFQALLRRVPIPYADIGHVISGSVIQECRTSNVAREATLMAGFPDTITSDTVTLASISSLVAAYNICDMISHGNCKVGIAGGVELLSDFPIRYHRKMRSAMFDISKAKRWYNKLNMGGTICCCCCLPDMPQLMGHTTGGESLISELSSSEKEDEFVRQSHELAYDAQSKGKLTDIVPIIVGGVTVKADDGIRDGLSKTNSYGSSFFRTDGASAALFTTKSYAAQMKLQPIAYLVDTVFVAENPHEDQILFSLAHAISKILVETKLELDDINVFEIHEGFARQIIANIEALNSPDFCQKYFNRSKPVGKINDGKLNRWGGSLALGHPFGATGIRLISHAANRLLAEGGKYALIAAGAEGGQGVAMILEVYKP